MKYSIAGGFLLSMLLLAGTAQATDPPVTVKVEAWGPPVVREFTDPPKDEQGKPLLKPGEDAVAVAEVESVPSYAFTGSEEGGDIKLKTVEITIKGNTVIHVPTDADQKLRDHEHGHDDLYRNEYAEQAAKMSTEAVQKLFERTFGSFEELDNAINDAIHDHGLAPLKRNMEIANEKYDRLTKHGTDSEIDHTQGVALTKQERAAAPPAGKTKTGPDLSQQSGATGPESVHVSLDPESGALQFGGDLLIAHALDPVDPIIGRGLFEIEPLLIIGPTESGAIHLSDTAFLIRDSSTGEALLDGFLLELAYRPASLPGFAGILQGYLDIPPDFADGIANSINSELLAGLGLLRDAGALTGFWLYTDAPLFDAVGNPLLPVEGVRGMMRIGVAMVPEPATWALFLIGFGFIGTALRQRRQRAA